jgi:hypothetical protein
MAGARKSKRSNSKLRNKTRRQRGGGGLLTPEEKQRIMNRVAGVGSYSNYQIRAAQKPWYLNKSEGMGGEIAPPVTPSVNGRKWWQFWKRGVPN